MSFLSPMLLFGLGAISLPILIHLWQRRRVVQVPFGSLRFLKAIAARTSRSSRIENLLLLLLRCLLFALVILAAARPVMLAKSVHLFGGEIPRTLVIVLDNSASMGYRSAGGVSRFDAAKSCALALFDDLKQGDRVAVIAAGDRADLRIAEPTIDRPLARKAVENMPLSQTRSDFATALREAGKIAARAPRGIHQIFLITDSQESGWQSALAQPASVFDTAWQQEQAQLVIVRPDDAPGSNACVKSVNLQAASISAGSTVRGSATIANYSSAPLHDVLSVTLGAERVAQRPVDAAPGATVVVPFEFQAPFVTGRQARGAVRLSGDHLSGDDVFHFTAPVFQTPHVVIAEGISLGPDAMRPGFFLRKALAAGSDSPVAARTLPVSQLEEAALDNETAVFLADPGKLGDRSVVRLERFLDAGGTVVLFPGDQTRLSDYANAAFLPAKAAGARNLNAGRQPVRIAEPNHPLFAGTWDAGTPFPALPQQRLIDWKPESNAQTLLTIGSAEGVAGGLPLLIYGERGAGRVLIVNASADRSWGDLPLSPAFVPLVQQIARLSAAPAGAAAHYLVGDPVPLSPALPRDKTITVTPPEGPSFTLKNTKGSAVNLLERADQAGIYEAAVGNEKTLVAVNIDRAESDLTPLAADALDRLASPAAQLAGRGALIQWLSRSQGLVPLWPALLVLALAVFAAESALSNLLARRHSQGDETQIPTGRLNRRRPGVPFHGHQPEGTR